MKEQEIADIYTLPPIQQGILFHSLYTPASDVYFEQFSWSIHADLDIAAFGQAWQTVVDGHPILRTSFFWEDMDEPLQVVRRRVTLPLERHDWSMLLLEEQQARLAALLVEDRRRRFDLNVAPLMRVSLILLNPTTYQIVWSYHHLLLDGWSVSLLLDEVFLCYEAYCRGEVPRLSERRPYRDYITWLRQKDLAGAEAFWRRTLRGFSAPTPLRIDHAAADGPTSDEDYAEQRAEFTAATTEALQSFTRQHRLTLNTLFQGAWALLLSCYSGEEEVVFGATVSGRPLDLRGSQAMIGLFINTLPVRVRVEPQADLLDWLNALQDQQVELREYEYSSLFEVHGWSEVPRSVPLFESIVVFENLAVNAFWHPKTTLIFQRTNFPLTLIVHPGPTLLVRAGYDPRRFDAAMIARLLHHLQVAFQHLIAHPRQHLMDFSLLTEAERSQLLVDGNATHMVYPQDVCVHELFATQAARTPDAIAVAFDRGQGSGVRGQGSGRQGDKETRRQGDKETRPIPHPPTPNTQHPTPNTQHLTYAELDRRANQLAHELRGRGVGSEVVVAVCMERSLELIVALLGILKTGGAYLPLDPSYPVERLAFMLEDSQAAVLLTQRRLSTRLPAHSAQVVCVDNADQVSLTEADSSFILHPSSFGANLAYVIYTSGSTGTPKGVLGLHRGMVNRFHWMWATYPFAAGEVCCQKTALSFVDSVWEVLGPLPQGVPLVVIPDELFKDLPRFVQTLAVTRVSRIVLVPTLLDVLLEMFPDLDQRLPALTYWISSGEALSAELCERFHARMPARILLNLYGASEVAADTTWHDTRTGPIGMHVPIGRPIANTQVYVLDRALRPVPVGVPGELHVGGVGLARGYHRRPDLTAERFIPNPFPQGMGDGGWGMGNESSIPHPPSPGTRLYRTGDLARYRDDGTLEFLSRVDHQVKIRGFRIEPGEIEAALARVEAVRQAVVVTHPDADGDLRLVAYIVPTSDNRPPVRGDSGQATTDHPPGADADAGRPGDQETSQPSALSPPPSAGSASFVDELRQVLQAQLPAYMIPATFVVLDTLPLNPSGKIDRRALPKPDGVQPKLGANFVPPRTELERMIAEIWQAFLHVDKVGIYDNFFELGGHSLMLVRMHSKLQGQIERELALIDLFRYPTIHLLATHLSQDTMATAATPDEGLSAKIEAGKNRLAQQRQHRQRALKPSRGSQ